MKENLKALVVFLVLFSTPVFSGEITDKEWIPVLNALSITYYHDGAYSEVNCMAFNKQGKPIGDGVGQPSSSGLAKVIIQVPTKYVETELKVSCNGDYQEEGSKNPNELESQKARVAAEVERLQKEHQEEEERRLQKKAAGAQAAVKHNLIDEYKAKILAKIKSNIRMPTELPGNPIAEFDVTLLPGGEILDVRLRTSSGFTTFDRAVEHAIVLSRPLPVPPNPLLFPNFRNLRLTVDYL